MRFPEVHDGYDRLGMVHEARGENRQAADCYRKVIALVREHPDDYGPGFEDVFVASNSSTGSTHSAHLSVATPLALHEGPNQTPSQTHP